MASIASDLAHAYTLASMQRLVWDRCSAYLRGQQYPGQTLGISEDPKSQPKGSRKRVIVNQLLNLRRHIAATLVTDYPSIAAIPATDSPDDIVKSRASETAIRYYWQQAKMRETLRTFIQYLVDWGTAGLHTYFDTQRNTVVTEVVRPYELRFEPYVTSPEESAWIGVVRYVRMQDLVQAYPEHAETLQETAPAAARYGQESPQSQPANRYELIDVYHRDGRHEVYAGGTLVWEGQTPGSRLPVQVCRYSEVSGWLWGVGLLEPLLEAQDLYNDARTQVRTNMRLVGNPRIVYSAESEIDANSFTDRPGEKVKFKVIPPSYMSPPPLPDYLTSEPAKVLSEMYDISGTYGTSLGKKVAGVTSGVAIQQTSQNATQQLQLTMDAIENCVKEMATDVLVLMKAFYTEAKMIRMLDRSGKLVWSTLDSTSLQDDPEIFLEAGSLFRSEAQDRDNRTLQLLQLGVLTPEQAKRNMSYRLEPLQIADQLAGLRHATEVLEAVRELGAPIKVYPTDDLEALETVFGSFMRQPEFYTLDPATQEAVDAAYQQILMVKTPPPALPGMPPAPGAPGGGMVAPGAGLPPDPGKAPDPTLVMEGASA